ncbi:chromobox protein homolog 1-like [Acropora millepora]|uniref:chromobox protein homolog 1-like n=1 Tax=Acropora millepora TaxID=45264 RepID=UPI001CF5E3D5|nr:chromobox protein homolog 1-like [Acropora millepora]
MAKKRKVEESEDPESITDTIVQTKKTKVKKDYEYLMKWKGWSLQDSSWEPSENLSNTVIRTMHNISTRFTTLPDYWWNYLDQHRQEKAVDFPIKIP